MNHARVQEIPVQRSSVTVINQPVGWNDVNTQPRSKKTKKLHPTAG